MCMTKLCTLTSPGKNLKTKNQHNKTCYIVSVLFLFWVCFCFFGGTIIPTIFQSIHCHQSIFIHPIHPIHPSIPSIHHIHLSHPSIPSIPSILAIHLEYQFHPLLAIHIRPFISCINTIHPHSSTHFIYPYYPSIFIHPFHPYHTIPSIMSIPPPIHSIQSIPYHTIHSVHTSAIHSIHLSIHCNEK